MILCDIHGDMIISKKTTNVLLQYFSVFQTIAWSTALNCLFGILEGTRSTAGFQARSRYKHCFEGLSRLPYSKTL